MRDFNHSIGVLVKAYIQETLEHTNCYACAVGNIIADACGYSFKPTRNSCQTIKWAHIPGDKYMRLGEPNQWYDFIRYNDQDDKDRILREIKSTGYSKGELNAIELAFESADEWSPDWMFAGLMSVVDVLAEIHGIDLTTREETKKMFVKS